MTLEMSEEQPIYELFPSTRWQVVNVLRTEGDTPEARAALASLCAEYQHPLYIFARRIGFRREDAEDATQSFFLKVVRENLFAQAMPEKGRLRSYLLAAFTNHLKDERRNGRAKKRGGGVEAVSLDFEKGEALFQREPADEMTPEFHFDRNWARVVVQAAFASLKRSEGRHGRAEQYEVMRNLIPWRDEETPASAAAAEKLGMTPEAMRTALKRLRDKLRIRLQVQVARTLRIPTEEQVEEEMEAVLAALRAG